MDSASDRATVTLAKLIRARQPCVVLTGAGISTESGIPDFRSPTGIWARYDPMEYATIDAFRRDPEKVWEFYALRLDALAEAEPNAGHLALAELERRGLVQAVVTQNIDGLHRRAGSQEVIEVHGSIRTAECLACGAETPLEHAMPRCPRCGELMKPGVVMFGELLPEGAMERAAELARGRAAARGRLCARGLSGRRAPGGNALGGRRARDRQPRAYGVRRTGRPEGRRRRRGDSL